MSLIDALQQERTEDRAPSCKVCTLPLDPQDAEALAAAFQAGMPASAIQRALLKEGHQIGETTLRRHRREHT